MKMKRDFFKIYLFLLIFFTYSGVLTLYCQDTSGIKATIDEAKIQLLEYNQKVLAAKLELLEIKGQVSANAQKKNRRNSIIESVEKSFIQKTDTMPYHDFKRAITFNVVRIFEGSLQLGYEQALKEHLSIDISFIGTYVTKQGIGRGYLESQSFGYTDSYSNYYINYYGRMIRGVGGTLSLKNYLLPKYNQNYKAPVGLYAAPHLMYRRVWITGNVYEYDYSYWGNQKEITRNLDVMQAGVILGNKFVLAKVLCVDVYAGGVMRLSKYYNEPTFTKYKRWRNIDYSGILPTAGINIGILK